jgi:hypothetical protein
MVFENYLLLGFFPMNWAGDLLERVISFVKERRNAIETGVGR